MSYTITRRLHSIKHDLSKEFNVTYCDRDFKFALTQLKAWDEGNWDDKLTRLLYMLQKYGYAYQAEGQDGRAFYNALAENLIALKQDFNHVYRGPAIRRKLAELKELYNSDWRTQLHKLILLLAKYEKKCRPEKGLVCAFYDKLITRLIDQGVIISSDDMSAAILGACEELFKNYREYPTSTDYMRRLVDRLCFPEDPWKNDTLRLRILKQFIKYGNYLVNPELGKKKPIQSYVGTKIGQKKVTDDEVLEHLDDHIFGMMIIPSTEEIAKAMRDAAEAMVPDDQTLVIREMILNAENARLPASFDEKTYQATISILLNATAMEQLAQSILLQHAAAVLGKDSVTAEETADVLGKNTCMTITSSASAIIRNAVTKEATCKSITKSMAKKLKEEQITAEKLLASLYSALHKAIRTETNEDYLLLRICDDLASGKFRTNGATKRDLYLFALVFHMTYYSPSQSGAVYDETRDVEKNLFTDYYATNVLQYLSSTYLNGKTDGEIDPAGCSINYKNYAEMIYLYYICQDYDNMSAAEKATEKIRRATKMINDVKVRGRNVAAPDTQDRQEEATSRMKQLIYGTSGQIDCEDIMALSEQDFKEFIIRHYDCRTNIDHLDVSPFQVNAEDRTAKKKYDKITADLFGKSDKSDKPEDNTIVKNLLLRIADRKAYAKDIYDSRSEQDIRKDYRYGLYFDEAYWRPYIKPENADTPEETTDSTGELKWVPQGHIIETDQEFYQIVAAVHNLLRNWQNDSEKINRTKLLAALYYDFNERYAINRDDCLGHGFREHYKLFCKEINPVLEECNYAVISCKNLLDMLIVLSSYSYINA